MAVLLGAVAMLVAVALVASASATASEGCPNTQLRTEDNSLFLPDCRAYELVSPPDKNGGAVAAPETLDGGGVLQAAAGGEAATFSSSASFGEGALGAPPASQYLSARTAAGWSTRNLTPATLSGAYGDEPDGVPYQLFSPDLSRALMLDGRRCAEGEECPRSYSLRDGDGAPIADSPTQPGLSFAGAAPDLGHVVFATADGLDEWSGGGLEVVSEAPGARLDAQAGAVSADGARVYFTAGGNLYLREGTTTRQVDEEVGGGGEFQTASADGTVAFFAKAGHLYRYEAHFEDLSTIDLTPGGELEGVLGASADGSVVYYQTASGLFRWQAPGTVTELAAGGDAAQPSDWPPTTGTARVTPDGSALAFLSKASLTGYDNADRASGEPDSEVFLWRTGAGLTCASCNSTGARPLGPSTIPGAIANGSGPGAADSYKPRDLSANGRRLFFDSADQIVPGDGSAAPDVYEWEASGEGGCAVTAGCTYLISSGRSAEASTFADASADGRDAFFLTADSLVPTDPGAVDLYDARAGGGFPMPTSPTPCEGDSCQPLPSPPEDPSPGTLVPGPSNPPPHYTKPKKKHRHHRKRRHRGKKPGSGK
ncbi:MAG: hypothetical protein ACTHO8_05135 [Solirubrobacterales bacterium]